MKKLLLFLSLSSLLSQSITTVSAMKSPNNTGIAAIAEKSDHLQPNKCDTKTIKKIIKKLLFLHLDKQFTLTPEEEKYTSLNELYDAPNSFYEQCISWLCQLHTPSIGKMLYKLSKDVTIENFLVCGIKKKYIKQQPNITSLNLTAMQLALVVNLLDAKNDIENGEDNTVYLHPDWLKVFNELPSSIQNYFEDIIENFKVTLY